MKNLFKWLAIFFCTLPALAQADPVQVSVVGNGFMRPDSMWLGNLSGADLPPGPEIPFVIRIDTQFDPDSPGYSESTSGSQKFAFQSGMSTTMSLTVGDRTFNISGTNPVGIMVEPGFNVFSFGFQQGQYDFSTWLYFRSADASFTGMPLTPRELSTGGNISAVFDFSSSYSNPDAPGTWGEFGTLTSASLSVVSVIPEPRQGWMLVVGFMVLFGVRRGHLRSFHLNGPDPILTRV